MGAVCFHGKVFGLDACRDVHRFVSLQLLLLDDGLQQFGKTYRFEIEFELPPPFHAHREDLFHHSAQPFQLLPAQGQVVASFALVGLLVKVEQGVVGGIGHGNGRLQLVGDVIGEVGLHLIECALPEDGLDQETVTGKVMAASRTIDKDVKLSRSEYVGPAVGEELVESGVIAIVVSLLAILAYIAFRFEWRMATGAVISLAYDVIVVLGCFSIMQVEYDLTVLAAVLTVVGYSLNDKIVVFDRIRENAVKLPRNVEIQRLFDVSLTQTLSRTIITSGTTLITVVSLMIFGGEMIYGFALALFVGIVFGTISSIYVASTWTLLLGIQRENLVPKKVERKETDGFETMD